MSLMVKRISAPRVNPASATTAMGNSAVSRQGPVSGSWRPILLKNSDLPSLLNQIAPMRHRRSDQRPPGPTAIEVAAISLCVALKAISATRATRDLQNDF